MSAWVEFSETVKPESTLGYGLGLRHAHYEAVVENPGVVDWFEIISEDYLIDGGRPLHYLERIRADHDIAMHGVSLSIGSTDPLDFDYLAQIKALARRFEACWISDHLCWTGVENVNLHDLLPVPYTEESLRHIVQRVNVVQDYLGQQILLENPSTYVAFATSTIDEADFIAALSDAADCAILLDVNNVYVNAYNHGFDAAEYIRRIPADRVRQIHLAGHSNCGDYIVDTHDAAIIEEVWSLYEFTVAEIGHVPTMIERDDEIPPFEELVRELDIARERANVALARVA